MKSFGQFFPLAQATQLLCDRRDHSNREQEQSCLQADKSRPGADANRAAAWSMGTPLGADIAGRGRPRRQFEYPDASKGAQDWWLVSENGEIELCLNDPGIEVDIVIKSALRTMTAVWTCKIEFDDAVREGEIEVFGDSALTKNLSEWLQSSALSQLGSIDNPPNLDWAIA